MDRKTEKELIRILPLGIIALLILGLACEVSGKHRCEPCQGIRIHEENKEIWTTYYAGFREEYYNDCLPCSIYENSDYDWVHRDTDQVLSICPKETRERREKDRLKKLKERK